MNDQVHPLVEDWYADKRATEAELAEVEQTLGVELPATYKAFRTAIGSGEAVLSGGYSVILHPAKSLLAMHAEEGSNFAEAQLLLFGSDGGGEAFAFDLRTEPCSIVMVALISDYEVDRIAVGADVTDLFSYPSRLGTSNG